MNTDELFVDGHKLPQPLSKEEVYKLIQEANEGSKEARDKLVTHNIRLVLYEVTNKFQNVDYDKKDLVSIGNIGLLKAINTYDLSKGFEFATYAMRCIDNEILMFLRKLKKDQSIDSLDRVIFHDKDGSEMKLEDKLSDDSDLVEDHENEETHRIIREVVKELPYRDKEIIMLHFGFYDDKTYTQREIADKFNISQSYVSRLITKIVKKVGKILESKGVIDLHSKQEKAKRKENQEEMPKLQTIYEYFKNYTREQINEMLTKLTEEERALVTTRYGENLDNPASAKLTKEQTDKFYGTLVPKMKRLLANPTGERKLRKPRQKKERVQQPIVEKPTSPIPETPASQPMIPEQVEGELITKQSEPSVQPVTQTQNDNGEMTKEDYIKMLELLRTPTFAQMMGALSVKESVIISLKLGYIDGKYFSTESIAQFLGIEETEVIETTKKVLLVYKESINNFLDNAIAVATDQVGQGRVLSMNPQNTRSS